MKITDDFTISLMMMGQVKSSPNKLSDRPKTLAKGFYGIFFKNYLMKF